MINYLKQIFFSLIIIFSVNQFAYAQSQCQKNSTFNIGASMYDITGPAAEEGMMGYGMIRQQTSGILQRLWARAFVIESPCNGKRVVFVNTDLGMVFQGIKQAVIARLKTLRGDRYSDDNVLLTATHEHSGPGGFSTDFFYNITTLGFSKENFEVIVDGIIQAILGAEQKMQPAIIKFAKDEITGISYNRSPQAYLLNPESERNQYQQDVDTKMSLIRIENQNGKAIGMINWFPIHGVSMNNKNHLINGDNKGYAEYLFEKDFHSDQSPQDFVAAFAQANAGDVSPNPYGHEGGEGAAGMIAIEKSGRPQYEKAKELYDHASEEIVGEVDYRHQFVKMDDVIVLAQYTDGQLQKTCPAAIGVSMLAGTQDGEGVGEQGLSCEAVQSKIPVFICDKTTTTCQGVKPIALETGTKKPYPWTPNILPFQIVKIGNLIIVAAPFELTTMTGRRIYQAVAKIYPEPNFHIVISALSNAYSGYTATKEEYQLQRYEGASTHFGPWQQAALLQEFVTLAEALSQQKTLDAGPNPPNLYDQRSNYQPSVWLDDKPIYKSFGDVYKDAQDQYKAGDEVSVIFWGGHPKNNFHTQQSFVEVQQLVNGKWKIIRTDNDWDTSYLWQRYGFSYSLVSGVWRIPANIPIGTYRIVVYGDWKSGWNKKIHPYTGHSKAFFVSA